MKKWQNYTKEQLREFAQQSNSYKDLALLCGYSANSGSSIATIRQMCEELQLDISHFYSQIDQEPDISIFQEVYVRRDTLKKNLILLRGHQCECCKLKEWNDNPIPLQVHHKNGDNTNSTLENLELLCPNCHAQTDNYCGKNKKREISDEEFIEALKKSENIHQALIKLGNPQGRLYERANKLIKENNITFTPKEPKKYLCEICGVEISQSAKKCMNCYHKSLQKNDRPSRDELKDLIRNYSFLEIGRKYNVSDNSIRKWCKKYNLPFSKREIKQYSDNDWILI